ncbi:MAG: 2-amino-4-hydroxy-6-hydroxymethyldihydropteridine diphosphokinase [Nocardioidaceae bacterium]
MTESPNPNIIDPDTLTGEMRPIRPVVMSLGSNLGERFANLQGAVNSLADTPEVHVVAVSSVYETEPVDAPPRVEELPQRRPARRHHIVGGDAA